VVKEHDGARVGAPLFANGTKTLFCTAVRLVVRGRSKSERPQTPKGVCFLFSPELYKISVFDSLAKGECDHVGGDYN